METRKRQASPSAVSEDEAAPRGEAGTPPAWTTGFVPFVHAWNAMQGRSTPPLHTRVARWLEGAQTGKDRRHLLMLFRDAGKSTLVGLYCAWLLSRDPNLRLLVLSAESGLATKMTRNVRRVIEQHPTTRHLLPRRKEEWASDQLTVRRARTQRDPSLLARGIGGNITGSRADMVICDDVEVPNNVSTARKRDELRERLREVGFVLVPGGTELFIGTPHSRSSIYAAGDARSAGDAPPFLGDHRRILLPVVDEAGHSLWPEHFGIGEIDALRRDAGPARFRSQMLVVPTALADMRLDPERLVRYEEQLTLHDTGSEPILTIGGRRMVGTSCWWDPALARPRRGDASVVAAVFTDDAGGYWLHGIRYLDGEPDGGRDDLAGHLCRQVVKFLAEFQQPSITIETNGLGRFLPALLRRALAEAKLGVAVKEHVNTMRKAWRILDALDPLLAARALHAHASIWETPLIGEMRAWLPGANTGDDGLDALSGCIMTPPVRLGSVSMARIRSGWRSGGCVFQAQADFRL